MPETSLRPWYCSRINVHRDQCGVAADNLSGSINIAILRNTNSIGIPHLRDRRMSEKPLTKEPRLRFRKGSKVAAISTENGLRLCTRIGAPYPPALFIGLTGDKLFSRHFSLPNDKSNLRFNTCSSQQSVWDGSSHLIMQYSILKRQFEPHSSTRTVS